MADEVLEHPLSTCHLPRGSLRLMQGGRRLIHLGPELKVKEVFTVHLPPTLSFRPTILDQNSLKSHAGSLLCLSATLSAGKELAETYVIGPEPISFLWPFSGGIKNLPVVLNRGRFCSPTPQDIGQYLGTFGVVIVLCHYHDVKCS